MTVPVRIVGVGSPAGGDRAGLLAIRFLKTSGFLRHFPPRTVDLIAADRPGTGLFRILEGCQLAIVIDALKCESPPGTLFHLTEQEDFSLEPTLSSHDFSVPLTLRLGRILGRLPPRIVLVGLSIGPGPEIPREDHPDSSLATGTVMDRLSELLLQEVEEFLTLKKPERQ